MYVYIYIYIHRYIHKYLYIYIYIHTCIQSSVVLCIFNTSNRTRAHGIDTRKDINDQQTIVKQTKTENRDYGYSKS